MLTLPWRKKEEGFQWVKHEKTQIRMQRQAREERLSALGYLVRICTSLLGLKFLEFVEFLFLKTTRVTTATTRWIKNSVPRLMSAVSVQAVAFFAFLRRITVYSGKLIAAGTRTAAKGTAYMACATSVRFARAMTGSYRGLQNFTRWLRSSTGPWFHHVGSRLGAQLRNLGTSMASLGTHSRDVTQFITRRIVDGRRTIAYATLTIVLFTGIVGAVSLGVFSQLPNQNTLTGAARIIDADLIKVGETDVRLFGVDAPEPTQRCRRRARGGSKWGCGREAVRRLSRLINGNKVRCVRKNTDSLGRLIGQCFRGKWDIGAYMVQKGLAWVAPGDPAGYDQFQRTAKLAGLGIWRAESATPWNYREARWQLAKTRAPEGCPVKGNISRAGRVYYLPWSNQYDRIRIQPHKGERWFCNEREAIQAGWRMTRYP